MNSPYEVFDAARLQLSKGVNLVEASAGTGKTHAIGMLVLRALVELEIPIEKILIVTFTKAATDELKARIRARLVEAKELFANKAQKTESNSDATLLEWASTINDQDKAYSRLQLALYDIDRAGIFTIHAFCQRMLVEQALESGQLFDVELLSDIRHVLGEVADDFWRNHIYSLDTVACSIVMNSFPTPDSLLRSVNSVLNAQGKIEPEVGSVDEVVDRMKNARTRIVAWWAMHSVELRNCFEHGIEQGAFKKGFNENFKGWFLALDDFFTGRSHSVPEDIEILGREQLAGKLNGTKLRGDEKKQAFLAEYPLPDSDIEDFVIEMHCLLFTIRVLLANVLREEVSRRLEQKGGMGFNDLILRLSAALKGERGLALKNILSERFSVALIDEFQDTDSAQWHIFFTLFGGGAHLLYLIGDPKQAIYKFRGADIHSYFLARKSATKLLTLDKNYRSHPYLVDEVNNIFSSRPNPFLFDESVLDYHSVRAGKDKSEIDLLHEDTTLAGLTYCTLDPDAADKNGRWSSGKAADIFRSFIITEIGRLLGRDQPIVQRAGKKRPLVPQDIAILVRSNRQAEAYRQSLADAGIPAVIGSRRSVFETVECSHLLLLLQAVAAPGDLVRLKTAMSIPWFGFSGYTLQKLWQNEEQASDYHERFLGYNQLWQEQGFMAMMSRLLVVEKVFVNLASRRMAERAIANIQHLVELIQEQESNESLGIGQVLQWLLAMTKEGDTSNNAELLLESDEQTVRIVTMHSAKGLEYAVVFCPYLWYRNIRTSSEKNQITCHDTEHDAVVDLGSEKFDERKQEALFDEKAEDLRLLYVALTRAQIRCYTMWADVKGRGSIADSFDSGLGYLLFPDGFLAYEQQQDFFAKHSRRESVIHQHISSEDAPEPYINPALQGELHHKPSLGRSLQTDWQMSSFSAMAMLSEYDHEQMIESTQTEDGPSIPVSGLPAGPNFGNVVHDMLELISFSEMNSMEKRDMQGEILSQKCKRYGVTAELSHVQKLLDLVVRTPLGVSPLDHCCDFTLGSLADSKCLKEMGFYYHVSRLATHRINSLLAGDPAVTVLSHKVMRGYLTGFIDLICEHNGRYYIIDYKTNYLGEMTDDYCPKKLVAAMHSHNYGLQYWIYTLVLHRHLKNILPGYSYQKHFGGIMYLFVRGMTPDIPGNGVFSTLPDYDTLLELDHAIGGVESD